MKDLKIFINLSRLNRPIGYLLLFWPCSWGLAYAFSLNNDLELFLYYLVLFFFGAVLMRSAGCIVNDIVDRDLDKKVKRTKNRPIASGKISIFESLIYIIFLCFLALLILLQFNLLTIILGLGSMSLAFAYPFMKRITYWPQLFLGLTFNWGIVMAWSSLANNISIEPIVLYLSAIFWTLGYDTIYGLQDIQDDEIIGVKSTSIKFKNNIKFFVGACYSLCVFFILILSILMEIDKYNLALSMLFIFSLLYQIRTFKKTNHQSCLFAFRLNNLTGLFIFLYIFSFSF